VLDRGGGHLAGLLVRRPTARDQREEQGRNGTVTGHFGRTVLLVPPRVDRWRDRLSYAVAAMDPTRPDWQIGPPRHRPRTLWSDLGGLWRRFRGLPIPAQLLGGVVAIILVIAIGSLLAGGGGSTNVATRSTTTRPPLTVTTTTLPPLPPGDDKAVKSVIDGDSFETLDGVKVRFIGIDAPDVETDACFSAEATVHLRELLPAGKAIRLVYDVTKTDQYGRTLAYVYSLPDGLLINVAQVKDGFAIPQPSQTNVIHNDDIAKAAADAKAANRGLWQACASTTTTAASRPATTAATTPATTEPPATEATTTTSSTLPASTTSSSSVGSTSTTARPLF
jgi:micrococcal nuclease